MKYCIRFGRFILLGSLLLALGSQVQQTVVAHQFTNQFREKTGGEITWSSFENGVLGSSVRITDLKIFDASERGGALLVEMPELYLEYDREAWAQGKIHLKDLRMVIRNVNLMEPRFW